ncbi:hypothetical protein [Chroococcidiopsis thermalis]|uniref:Uncharacterized protein n=1 Tax=Chroococcidiopsis thermalis (strain PCC 7203) TaxID=251229 RepID=K9U988_CHRTP|nr:hypothetical protein [Chroococcidiopsis thermalis]AFY91178.1 hypothetical protein Chro_5839 [Chroococcidiopsis thermalis PCC 7203]
MDASTSTLHVFFALSFSSTFAVALLATYWHFTNKQTAKRQFSRLAN